MARKKRPREKGRFLGIPYNIASTEQFYSLGFPEMKLLVDLLYQYNGSNNGMLSPTYSLLKDRGWAKKKGTLYRAFASLESKGFLVVTRRGWKERGKPTLVAITWKGIDEPCKGIEYDEAITCSNVPLSYWCRHPSSWQHKPTLKAVDHTA